ncbi:MAG: quinol:cytochrome C oxidoreductase [Flavobacteriales bacterium]|nr:quinol:cytochrome C oxidoreductase [Flavobacteriales bacterium]
MFTITKNARNLSFGLMIIGVTALILGFVNDAHSAWPSLLFNTYFFLGISVFAVFFIALQYVAEASWSIVLKRVPEAIISFLPISGIIMLIIMVTAVMHFGGNHIYHWMADGIMDKFLLDDLGNQILDEKGNPILNPGYDKIIAGKAAFLDTTFFLIRSVIYILGWVYFGRKLKQLSLNEDKHGGLENYNKGFRTSAWFMVFFAITSSIASWDWIMSIDTHWFSTLFGWYVFSEWAVIGFVSILLITLYLKRLGYLESVNESHIHDLGKYVFAFSLVWTYMWFSQFMLIWYSNIPEEVAYFTARLEVENYKFLFWFRVAINFLFPIILLMSRDAKRNNSRLIFVCIVILIGHWLNSYLLVTPGVLNKEGHIGFTEIGMGLGFFGLFIYVVFNALTKAPLETKNHPFLDESKHLHT